MDFMLFEKKTKKSPFVSGLFLDEEMYEFIRQNRQYFLVDVSP